MKGIARSLVMGLALAVASAGLGAQTPGVTATSIKIGTTQAMTGAVAVIGKNVAEGLKAWFAAVNRQGGINGRQVELVIADDQFNPANTVVETKRLVESDKVFAMVGSLGTPCVLAVMDYLNQSKVPFVYQGAGANRLADPPKRYVFPFQPNYLVEGNVMVRYLVEKKGKKNIAIIYRNAEDGKDAFKSVSDTIASYPGVRLAAAVPVDPAATSFATEIGKLQDSKPDAVIAILFSPQNSGFMKQATEFGFRDPLFLFNYATPDPTVIAAAGAAVMEGVEAMGWLQVDYANPNFPAWKVWQDYAGAGSLPNAFATAGMLAGELFTEAARKAGKDLDREKLVAALESMKGWSGILVQNATYGVFKEGDPSTRLGKQSMYPLVVRKGVWEVAGDWVDYKPVRK